MGNPAHEVSALRSGVSLPDIKVKVDKGDSETVALGFVEVVWVSECDWME